MNAAQQQAIGDMIKLAVRAAAGEAMRFTIAKASNAPIPEPNSAQLRIGRVVSDHGLELPEYRRHPDLEGDALLLERVVERGTVEAELEIRVVRPATVEAAADHVARSIRRKLARETILDALVGADVELLGSDDVVDVSELLRDGAEAESRALFGLRFAYTITEDSTIDRIASVGITGTVTSELDEVELPAIEIEP